MVGEAQEGYIAKVVEAKEDCRAGEAVAVDKRRQWKSCMSRWGHLVASHADCHMAARMVLKMCPEALWRSCHMELERVWGLDLRGRHWLLDMRRVYRVGRRCLCLGC